MSRDRIDRRDFLGRIGLSGLSLSLGAACGQAAQKAAPEGSETRAPEAGGGPGVALCTIAFQDRPLEEVLQLAAATGFDAVEPWGKPEHLPLSRTDDEVRTVKARLDELGLKASHYGSYVRLGDGQPPEEKNRDMDRAVLITRLLGTNICRMWAGLKDSELLAEEDWALMVEDGKRFCARAETAGVVLAIEMHGNSVTNKAAAAIELIERVGSPALRLNYQILNSSEDPYERAQAAGPYVVMVHAQNSGGGQGQASICGGSVDFQKVYDILKPFGFTGYFEVEFVGGQSYEEKVEALKKDYECLRAIS